MIEENQLHSNFSLLLNTYNEIQELLDTEIFAKHNKLVNKINSLHCKLTFAKKANDKSLTNMNYIKFLKLDLKRALVDFEKVNSQFNKVTLKYKSRKINYTKLLRKMFDSRCAEYTRQLNKMNHELVDKERAVFVTDFNTFVDKANQLSDNISKLKEQIDALEITKQDTVSKHHKPLQNKYDNNFSR